MIQRYDNQRALIIVLTRHILFETVTKYHDIGICYKLYIWIVVHHSWNCITNISRMTDSLRPTINVFLIIILLMLVLFARV